MAATAPACAPAMLTGMVHIAVFAAFRVCIERGCTRTGDSSGFARRGDGDSRQERGKNGKGGNVDGNGPNPQPPSLPGKGPWGKWLWRMVSDCLAPTP